jgi:hypothetical protein
MTTLQREHNLVIGLISPKNSLSINTYATIYDAARDMIPDGEFGGPDRDDALTRSTTYMRACLLFER